MKVAVVRRKLEAGGDDPYRTKEALFVGVFAGNDGERCADSKRLADE